jgi:hypothetical protein
VLEAILMASEQKTKQEYQVDENLKVIRGGDDVVLVVRAMGPGGRWIEG